MSIESPNSGRSFGEWVRYVWDEGLARHVIIEKAAEGKRPVNLPLTFVLVGGLLAPWLLALGVLVAVLRGYAIRVEGGGQPAPTEPLDEAAADVSESAITGAVDSGRDDGRDRCETGPASEDVPKRRVHPRRGRRRSRGSCRVRGRHGRIDRRYRTGGCFRLRSETPGRRGSPLGIWQPGVGVAGVHGSRTHPPPRRRQGNRFEDGGDHRIPSTPVFQVQPTRRAYAMGSAPGVSPPARLSSSAFS